MYVTHSWTLRYPHLWTNPSLKPLVPTGPLSMKNRSKSNDI